MKTRGRSRPEAAVFRSALYDADVIEEIQVGRN
jgi:hypothetical protein